MKPEKVKINVEGHGEVKADKPEEKEADVKPKKKKPPRKEKTGWTKVDHDPQPPE